MRSETSLSQSESAECPGVESRKFKFAALLVVLAFATGGLIYSHRPPPPPVVALPIPDGWPTLIGGLQLAFARNLAGIALGELTKREQGFGELLLF